VESPENNAVDLGVRYNCSYGMDRRKYSHFSISKFLAKYETLDMHCWHGATTAQPGFVSS